MATVKKNNAKVKSKTASKKEIKKTVEKKIGSTKKSNTPKKNAKVSELIKEKPKKKKSTLKSTAPKKIATNNKVKEKPRKVKTMSEIEDEFYIDDDELKTKINLPIIKDINLKKKTKNILKEYDIKTTNKEKKRKSKKVINKNKIKVTLLSICKVIILFIKSICNLLSKLYNNMRHLILKDNKGVKKNTKIKSKKNTKEIKKDNPLLFENLELLKYKDHKGILKKIKVFFKNRVRVIKFDMKRFKDKFKYGTVRDKVLILLMLILIALFSCIIIFCAYIVVTAPEISNTRLYKQNSSVFLDADGNVFARRGTENREKVSYDELPEVLVDAVVSAEDSRFFQHNGIDIARFTKAVIGQLMGRSDAGGGSTLTMQVSKNAATSTSSHGIKGIIRKFQDIYLSVFVFEKKYTKEQIMEFYVNIPYLGSGTYGVQQASKVYFGKQVTDLTLVEAATIAGLFQSPDAYDPYNHPKAAENRRNTILNLMERHGYITEEECEQAKNIPLSSLLVGKSNSGSKYQDFIDTVTKEVQKRTGLDPATTSMTIYTTMIPEKQDVVNGIINGETYTWKNEKAQAGIAVIDVESGALIAVGASRDQGQLVLNRATEISRHPGSTAKPVIDYGPAIEYLGWSTGQTIIDDKLTYSGGGQIKNFDNGYKEIMTAKTALAQSRNIPALYTFQQTTNEQKLTFANNLGWHPEDKTGYIVESASIGGFEGVSPLQSAAAYATFARGGTYIEPYSFTKAEVNDTGEVYEVTPKKVQAMSEETAYMINMILKYAVSSGSVSAGSVSGTDLCGKTGTSTVDATAKKNAGITGNVIGDSWTVAYSPDYAISTWYGYDKQLDKEYHLTNSEGGTARKTITKILTKGIMKTNSTFTKPDGVVEAEIELGTDPLELASAYTPSELRATEYFKKGTVPTEESQRFAQLSNPSDLKYSSTDYSVSLSWKAASTPNAINTEWLKEYFNNNVYKNWADKYLQQRINYNNSTFGSFGYEIYMTNNSGTVDLGFTTNTSFSANVAFDNNTTFTVKSSYQNFKANQSSGIQATVAANSSSPVDDNTQTNTTQKAQSEQINLSVTTTSSTSCVTYSDFMSKSKNDLFEVKVNGQSVPQYISITPIELNDNDVKESELASKMTDANATYKILYNIAYTKANISKNVQIYVKPSC